MRLSWDALASLPAHVTRPAYQRSDRRPGVVHFGVGGFHRSHQAVYLDTLMNQGQALDWGIVGVGTQPSDEKMRDALTAQDCLYTVVLTHPDGREDLRVIGSIVDYLYAPDDPEAVLARLTQPETRVVSLTITEGGYHLNPQTGQFEAEDAVLLSDAMESVAPRTVFGFIVEGLRRRRERGIAPFTLVSCDNLPGNGQALQKAVVGFAAVRDADLSEWIAATVAFPSSMVDRITPGTTAGDIAHLGELGVQDSWPVVCEPFSQWVLEDDFTQGRPPFEDAGVQLVDDVVPYELTKLRLLNASHQALCYLGYLAGYTYAHEVCQDPDFADFILGYMVAEAAPTLPPVPGVDVELYCGQLLNRFSNPHIRDPLTRLCAESSDRIPKWIIPVIHENLAAGRAIERAALVVASWARYAEGVDERGRPIDVVDRSKEAVTAAAARQAEDPLAFIRDRELFGSLAGDERFAHAYRRALSSLHDEGARASIAVLAARHHSSAPGVASDGVVASGGVGDDAG